MSIVCLSLGKQYDSRTSNLYFMLPSVNSSIKILPHSIDSRLGSAYSKRHSKMVHASFNLRVIKVKSFMCGIITITSIHMSY